MKSFNQQIVESSWLWSCSGYHWATVNRRYYQKSSNV